MNWKPFPHRDIVPYRIPGFLPSNPYALDLFSGIEGGTPRPLLLFLVDPLQTHPEVTLLSKMIQSIGPALLPYQITRFYSEHYPVTFNNFKVCVGVGEASYQSLKDVPQCHYLIHPKAILADEKLKSDAWKCLQAVMKQLRPLIEQ